MSEEKNESQFDILKEKMEKFLQERDWKRFHTPKNVAMAIAIEAAELMELFQWTNPSAEEVIANGKLMENVQDELADIIIYSISLALSLKIDLFESIKTKMEKNIARFPPGSQPKL